MGVNLRNAESGKTLSHGLLRRSSRAIAEVSDESAVPDDPDFHRASSRPVLRDDMVGVASIETIQSSVTIQFSQVSKLRSEIDALTDEIARLKAEQGAQTPSIVSPGDSDDERSFVSFERCQ